MGLGLSRPQGQADESGSLAKDCSRAVAKFRVILEAGACQPGAVQCLLGGAGGGGSGTLRLCGGHALLWSPNCPLFRDIQDLKHRVAPVKRARQDKEREGVAGEKPQGRTDRARPEAQGEAKVAAACFSGCWRLEQPGLRPPPPPGRRRRAGGRSGGLSGR